MAQLKNQLPANLPEATIQSRVRQFLLKNSYYELESKDHLRFRNYPEARNDEAPTSIQHDLVLSLSDDALLFKYKKHLASALEGDAVWEHQYLIG